MNYSKLDKANMYFKMDEIKDEEFYLVARYDADMERTTKVHGFDGDEIKTLFFCEEEEEAHIDFLIGIDTHDAYLVVFDKGEDGKTFYEACEGSYKAFYNMIDELNSQL